MIKASFVLYAKQKQRIFVLLMKQKYPQFISITLFCFYYALFLMHNRNKTKKCPFWNLRIKCSSCKFSHNKPLVYSVVQLLVYCVEIIPHRILKIYFVWKKAIISDKMKTQYTFDFHLEFSTNSNDLTMPTLWVTNISILSYARNKSVVF